MSGVLAVFGGTGFIGRAVAAAARKHGYRPVLLAPEAPPGAAVTAREERVVPCDVADPGSVRAAFAQVRPTAVVSLAAFGSGPQGLLAGAGTDPAAAVAVNVGGLVHIVEAAAEVGVRRVVWSSSTTVYGPARLYGAEPVEESAPLAPQSVYGATKAGAELLAPGLEARLGVRPVALRLPLVYGPGRWYGGSQDALVAFVQAIAARRPAELRADTSTADWIYVDDAAAAFLAALDAEDPAHAYNLVGHRSSLADVGRALAAQADTPARVHTAGDGGVDLPLTDDRAARRDLGFRPRFDLPAAAADYLTRMEAHP